MSQEGKMINYLEKLKAEKQVQRQRGRGNVRQLGEENEGSGGNL